MRRLAILALAGVLGAGTARADDAGRNGGAGLPTAGFTAEVAVRWARLLYERIAYERLSPPPIPGRHRGPEGVRSGPPPRHRDTMIR